MQIPPTAFVLDVGPRDGFQGIGEFIPTHIKLGIIERLVKAGIKRVQITSFVSPKAIPQMADRMEVASRTLEMFPDADFCALVPSIRGCRDAHDVGLRKINFVVSLSESSNKANVNKTHEQSFNDLNEIMQAFPDMDLRVDLATTYGCAYEGMFTASQVVDFVGKLVDAGVRKVTMCDSIGTAYPSLIEEVIVAVRNAFPQLAEIWAHIHDTRNMGIINTFTALQAGVNGVETTIGGSGGCPYAPGASGNTSTEDLIYMLNSMGVDTGVNFDKLMEAAVFAYDNIPTGNFSSHQIMVAKGLGKACGA